MNISAPFIRRPVMTTFVMLSILFCGVLAYLWLPVTDLPSVESPNILVLTEYSGASPETVLEQITIPLEKELLYVKGVQEVTSKSTQGASSIKLAFDFSKDMSQAIADVQLALHHADDSLPEDLEHKPTYFLRDSDQEPILELALASSENTIGELHQLATSYLLPRLQRIEGVADVEVFGEEKSIWLRLNPELMAARHVSFNQVIDGVKQGTAHEPLGGITTGTDHLSIEWPSSIVKAKDLENIPVGDGKVLVKDIGEVSEVPLDARESRFVTKESATPSLVLFVQKISGANTVSISKEIHRLLENVKKELPPTVQLTVWFDKAVWISSSLADVEWSLGFSFCLVMLIIYLSLKRISDSLVTGISLPLSLLGTLAIMYTVHFSIDLLSLLALTLSCGFVVDDAIVMLENIARHREKGKSSFEASLVGSQQICFTILSITLSLVAVFIPLLFMPGMNGRLFREFSCTLAIAIVVSGIVSLTIIPMLCSRLSSGGAVEGGDSWIRRAYASSLRQILRYPKAVLVCSVLCLGASVVLFTYLPVNLIPTEDRGFLFAMVETPQSPSQSNEKQLYLEHLLRNNPSIESFFCVTSKNDLQFVIRLVPKQDRIPQEQVIEKLQNELDSIPGISGYVFPRRLINLNLEFKALGHYGLSVRGPTFEEVQYSARELSTKLEQRGLVTSAKCSVEQDSPQLCMRIDERRAHHFGFEKTEIQSLLQQAFGQTSIGSLQGGGVRQPIFVELLPSYCNTIDAPSKLYLTSPNEDLVPFKALASWEERLGISHLNRSDGVPSARVHFSLSSQISPHVGLDRVEKEAARLLPEGVSATLTGSAKSIASAMYNTFLLLLAAVIVMYIILGILYESFMLPLIILSSIPFACLGGVLTLLLAGEPLSLFSAVGFLLLIGIVKKNGIMMVDCAKELRQNGMSIQEAIYEACLLRFRPIMMTTIAAIMGAIPIAIGIGESAEMLKGLGLVIVGGLVFSQVLTLYITPVLYVILSNLFGHEERC